MSGLAHKIRMGPALLLVLLALLLPGRSWGGDPSVAPGRMGPNALPTIPNADPVPDDDILVDLQAAAQLSELGLGGDRAFTPYAHLVIPFRGVAAFEADGVPFESWRVSPQTQLRLGARGSSGRTPGDVRFGARFLLCSEGAVRPAIGFRFLTKSTTGKGFIDRRFTNSPAYVLDLIFGKDLVGPGGPGPRIRLLAKAGFTAWEQGANDQDDALDGGATLQLLGAWAGLDLEWRGYFGWEKRDKPQLLGLRGMLTPGVIDFTLTVNRGLSADAPAWEARVGVVLHIPTFWN